MMNRNVHLHTSAALTASCVSALSSFAYYAASFYSALRFYFYYFFASLFPSERKLVS